MSKTEALRFEALSRARTSESLSNYPTIFAGLAAKGIPESEIRPRENVFTFHAWKALGRHVRKGEHGVKILTYVDGTRKRVNPETGAEEEEPWRCPWSTTVFHVTQTEPDESKGPESEAPHGR